MANEKISELTELTTLANNDLFVTVDVSDTTMAPSGTNKKITALNILAAVQQSIYFSPFGAKPTTFAALQAALAANVQYIYIPSTIALTGNLQLTTNTCVLFAPNAELDSSAGYRIDLNNFDLVFIGSGQIIRLATWNPTSAGQSFIYNASGAAVTHTFSLINGRIRNSGSLANTPICSDVVQKYQNASVLAGNADNAGVYLTVSNSNINDLVVISGASPASTNTFKADESTANITKLELVNDGSVTSSLANIGFFNKLSQIDVTGEFPTALTIGSSCSQLASSDGSDINLTINGGNVHLSDITVNDLDISGATAPTITGSYATGTFTPVTGYKASACTGSIINTDTGGAVSSVNGNTGDVDLQFSFKNRLINADMRIDAGSPTRASGASQTITAGDNYAQTVNRWFSYCTGADVTGQQIAGSASTTAYRYQFTGNTGVTGIYFGQRIESANSYDLAGNTCTLSAYIENSLLTSVTWTAYYADTTDTFGTVGSPSKTQIATGTFTVTSSRARYETQISVPSAAVTGIEIVFNVETQTSGTWIIDNVQLEKNATATSFDYRPTSTEIDLCNYYYWQSWGFGVFTANGAMFMSFPISGSPSNSIGNVSGYPFMRAAGTVTIYDETGAAGTVTQPAVSNGIAVSILYQNNTGFNQVLAGAPFAVGTMVKGFVLANAELF